MKIRAITAFADIVSQGISAYIEPIGKFMTTATRSFEHAGVAVQSRRLATQPFPHIPGLSDPGKVPELARELFHAAKPQGIDYVSLGVVKAEDDPAYIDAIPAIFRAAEGVFASVEIASPQHGIDLAQLVEPFHLPVDKPAGHDPESDPGGKGQFEGIYVSAHPLLLSGALRFGKRRRLEHRRDRVENRELCHQRRLQRFCRGGGLSGRRD